MAGVTRPLGHIEQTFVGPSEYVPTLQREQTLLLPGTFVANEPAGQIMHDVEPASG